MLLALTSRCNDASIVPLRTEGKTWLKLSSWQLQGSKVASSLKKPYFLKGSRT